jgi:hypothetical protein
MAIANHPTVKERDAEVPPFPVYRLNVAQYQRMVETGVLTDEDRVELLEGWLVPKVTKKQPHHVAAGKFNDRLVALVPAAITWPWKNHSLPATTAKLSLI